MRMNESGVVRCKMHEWMDGRLGRGTSPGHAAATPTTHTPTSCMGREAANTRNTDPQTPRCKHVRVGVDRMDGCSRWSSYLWRSSAPRRAARHGTKGAAWSADVHGDPGWVDGVEALIRQGGRKCGLWRGGGRRLSSSSRFGRAPEAWAATCGKPLPARGPKMYDGGKRERQTKASTGAPQGWMPDWTKKGGGRPMRMNVRLACAIMPPPPSPSLPCPLFHPKSKQPPPTPRAAHLDPIFFVSNTQRLMS